MIVAAPVHIKDGAGSGSLVRITSENLLKTTQVPSASRDWTDEELLRWKILRSPFSVAGDLDDISLAVDASSATKIVNFQAVPGRVIFVKSVRFVLKGTLLEIDTNNARGFGSGNTNGLANGVEFVVRQSGEEFKIFATPVKELIGFLDSSVEFTSIKNSISQQSDFLSFDFRWSKPVVLIPTSLDRIEVRINDDLSGLDSFEVHVLDGWQDIL